MLGIFEEVHFIDVLQVNKKFLKEAFWKLEIDVKNFSFFKRFDLFQSFFVGTHFNTVRWVTRPP